VDGDARVALRTARDLEQPAGTWPARGVLQLRAAARLVRPLRPSRFYLLAAALLAGLGSLDAIAELQVWHLSPALAAINLSASLTFTLAGLMLAREPGQRGVAWALILAGTLRSVDFVDTWNTGPWPAYAVVFGAFDRVCGAWAILRYPMPRLRTFQRGYLGTLIGWMLVGRILVLVTSTARSTGYSAAAWWPTIVRDPGLSQLAEVVLNCGEGILGITLIVLLVLRLRETTGLDRIVIAPIIAAGLAAVIAASVTAVAQLFSNISTGPTDAYVIEGLVDVTLPLAFLVAVIQRALLAGNLAELSARVSVGADLGSVRYALRETLHDPTLEVLELPDPAASLGDGAAAPPHAPGSVAVPMGAWADSRLVEVIHSDAGAPIAVVIADAALARYRGLFDAAVRTSGLALQNAQLQAQAARAELEHVRASRARIVAAGLAERRRLERDLHDGAQQRLLGMAARLTAAMASTADAEATAAFRQARAELAEVLAELRDLAHGIHPVTLTQGGLSAALEEVVERLPLAVELSVPPDRVAPGIEAAVYFVACEALSNAVKHASASSVTVTVRFGPERLELDIRDDGVGGADPAGSGLAHILDRVSALDGEAVIDSPPGRGTWIRASIPRALTAPAEPHAPTAPAEPHAPTAPGAPCA
jgi:signal transduction histidine kinase